MFVCVVSVKVKLLSLRELTRQLETHYSLPTSIPGGRSEIKRGGEETVALLKVYPTV